ncbi:MAG: hypothetical protein NZ561_13640 [Phycisphaerae bacterium]|nr:hypothetical protein [Phycisphaerae bacterium]MDW8263060.1 hypothetical protein [Phycisphaerales bacterium]
MNLSSNPPSSELARTYLDLLLAGDRLESRRLIEATLASGATAYELLVALVYPTMELMQALYREDRISITQLNLGTRLNRSITDQLCHLLPRNTQHGRKALIVCGNAEPEELGGQICADLFESDGWNVRFTGAGVPDDEILKLLGEYRPDLLIFFATLPQGMPAVRKLIDYIREINCLPSLQIMCCGGIYKRAEGLAEEIGADLYAPDAASAVRVANENPTRRATVDQQTVGRTRRIKKAEIRRRQQAQRLAPRPMAPRAEAA